MAVSIPCPFLVVLCVGLQSMIVVFPDHIHLLLDIDETFCRHFKGLIAVKHLAQLYSVVPEPHW